MQSRRSLASTRAYLSNSAGNAFRIACARGDRQSPSGLALTGKRLKLAILLAVLPTFVGIAGVIAFAISIAIQGF